MRSLKTVIFLALAACGGTPTTPGGDDVAPDAANGGATCADVSWLDDAPLDCTLRGSDSFTCSVPQMTALMMQETCSVACNDANDLQIFSIEWPYNATDGTSLVLDEHTGSLKILEANGDVYLNCIQQ